MSYADRKPQQWREFNGGMSGWDVALNTTGFHHVGLLFDYAEAYRKAGRRLFDDFRQTEDSREMDMHPVIFLFRHSVEVYLKTILWLGNGVLIMNGLEEKAGDEIFRSHSLEDLLPSIKLVSEKIDCSDLWVPPLLNSFADFQRIIVAINEIPYEAFRYPVDRTGRGELLERPLHFNALVFTEKLDALLSFLYALTKRVDETFQNYFRQPAAQNQP